VHLSNAEIAKAVHVQRRRSRTVPADAVPAGVPDPLLLAASVAAAGSALQTPAQGHGAWAMLLIIVTKVHPPQKKLQLA